MSSEQKLAIPGDSAEILEAIRAQVRAEMETMAELRRQNDLAEKALAELQRNRAAEQQRVKLAFDTNDKVSGIIPALQPAIKKAFRDIRQINRRLHRIEQRGEQTDEVLLLLLTERSPQKIEAARQDLEDEIAERKKERKSLIRRHTRNLARLKEMAAGYGPLSVPLEVLNSIEAEKDAIIGLEGEL